MGKIELETYGRICEWFLGLPSSWSKYVWVAKQLSDAEIEGLIKGHRKILTNVGEMIKYL